MSYTNGCSNSIPSAYIDDRCGAKIPESPRPLKRKENLRDIRIKAMDAGFIVEVGCQTFAIESKQSLITKLSAYINDPENVEIAWMNDHKLPKK